MWTPEEDHWLLTGVSKHGAGNWAAIRADTGLKRNSAQMNQRYARLMRKKAKAEEEARKAKQAERLEAKRAKREADGAEDLDLALTEEGLESLLADVEPPKPAKRAAGGAGGSTKKRARR